MGSALRRLGMIMEYDGTEFCGFQRQGDLRTVQLVMEQAASRVFGHSAKVRGAGRTDSGVHAIGQVISTDCMGSIPTDRMIRALNSILPEDIAVSRVVEVEEQFCAQRCATSKVYRYVFSDHEYASPFVSRYALPLRQRVDIQAMQEAASQFEGSHDFAAFRATGSSAKTTTRTVLSSKVSVREAIGRLIVFEIEANGFLYNMVRIMAGTLLEVGRGRIGAHDVSEIMRLGARENAGPTLPPNGLWLMCVRYERHGSLTATHQLY